jgi:glyoxylase-like metal-dependent hydrolase (beta-lactamase superfamily II)
MLPPDDFNPPVGAALTLEPGLRRIVAPNPSAMTYRGTNTYLLGTCGIAVIDPGPANPAHMQAILSALTPDQHISHIVVTHTHLDHSPLARPLAQATDAPVIAFGGPAAGRSAIMQALVQTGLMGGGEGIDDAFSPDETVMDGAEIAGDGWALEVLHTPGHIGNHLSLGWGSACFTADHVMGWASSLVSPPDGDLTDFMASCGKLAARDWRVFYPGHGAPVADPAGRLDWLIKHRQAREAAIVSTLESGPADAVTLAATIYADIPPALLPAATRNVLAHLVDLQQKSRVEPIDTLNTDAQFRLI